MPPAAPHTIPPELHAHYRRVRVRPGAGLGCLWGFRLFILPHTLVGLALLFLMPASIVWAALGRDFTADVTRTWVTRGSKGSYHHHADLVYTLPDGQRREKLDASITSDAYHRLAKLPPAEQKLTVRAIGSPPAIYESPVGDGNHSAWTRVGMFWLFGTFWNGILSVFVYLLYVAPWRERRLYKFGLAAAGVVVAKRVSRGKNTHYYVRYRFTPPNTREPIEREMTTTKDQWEPVEPGQAVTVLYHPDKPKRNVAYELGSYVCTPA